MSDYKQDVFLAEKWSKSLLMLQDGLPVAVIIAYIKQPELNTPYTEPCLYINSIAVASGEQGKGYGTKIINEFIKINQSSLSKYPTAVQTNSAEWNSSVINFYKKIGFKVIGTKQYPDRTDFVFKFVVPQN